ncbi:hypothetical protein JNUCC1_02826 [Lentibacillus sp. JNUCC-1]|uniref:hypothetical protein n=1 Tax=Lentibacillus sp. JNUCC-1 TaxID=2654513 RepID=UPI0012E7527C|nr:hypothetical protein [Lentibacillus sp. JNUCC-1]MUV38954.1 hypothetical protein [Lentibacillus sp. JNUCC-1]
MKYLLYGTVGLVVIIIVLNLLMYDAFYVITNTIEWLIQYVLPWIALYWFVQFVNHYKNRTGK